MLRHHASQPQQTLPHARRRRGGFLRRLRGRRRRGDDGGLGRKRRYRLHPSAGAAPRRLRGGARELGADLRRRRPAARAHHRGAALRRPDARRPQRDRAGRRTRRRVRAHASDGDQRLRAYRRGLADDRPPRDSRTGGAAPRRARPARAHAALIRAIAFVLAALLVQGAEAADARKVVRVAYPSAESKLDPQAESDEASGGISDNIFDSLLEYDYLARPAQLKPRAAVALAEMNADGTIYTLRVKPGIYFTPDPAFKGKRRELVAQDLVYSLKRLFNPSIKSQWLFLVEGEIKGAEAVAAEAKKTNRFDFDRPIEGLQAIDRYTLRIKLNHTDYGFPFVLPMPPTGAVAREVVDFYGDDFHSHPVGTGPYILRQWIRGSRLVLEANPDYREEVFESAGADDERTRESAASLKGKRLPLAGRVEVYIIEESQPRWLAFLGGEHDYMRPVPEEFGQIALPNGELAPNLRKKGVRTTPDEAAW